MKSQWECLLQNLGAWQGSFTRLSPEGVLLEDTPTIVSFEGLDHNQTMRQTVRRLGSVPEDKVLEYSTLGRGILLFENGAFSQGSIQFGPFSEFGAELGLIAGDRRLRLVQLFNRESRLDLITLIREQRAGTDAPERPPLKLTDLLGQWQGEAVTLYPDLRSPDHYSTHLEIRLETETHLVQTLSFGTGEARRSFSSTAIVEDSRLRFNQGAQEVQILLLPDGASSNCPWEIKPRQPFVLEVGWLLQPGLRQRLVRSYDSKGEWTSLTLVTEQRV